MLNQEDIFQIEARGSSVTTVEQQITNFRNGFPYLQITEAASNYHGIIKLSEAEVARYSKEYDEKILQGIEVIKFVPASGAASRMFKSLFTALENFQSGNELSDILKDKELESFQSRLKEFAFYDDLLSLIPEVKDEGQIIPLQKVLELLLLESGLNYGNLPKGLLKFHRYHNRNRTPVEEHFVEGASYSKNKEGKVNIHFTVSPEHQSSFEQHIAAIKSEYEELFGVKFQLSIS